MKRLCLSFSAGALALCSFASIAAAADSVKFNGNTYYVVNGNDPKMDSGNEVCASMGMKFAGYKSINTNGVCKTRHPTAREITSVNGSKAGFYCNGAPQTGLACGNMKNTCQVCPACNLNEAADGNQTIGGHFAEMYVFCEGAMSKSPMYGALPLPKSSSSRSSSPPAGGISCTYSNSPLKRATCTAYKAGDSFCATAMGSTLAKAVICNNTTIKCTLPCSAPNSASARCATGGVKSGTCPRATAPSGTGPKDPGVLCQNGGECKSGMCLGVVPGREYRCSCIGSQSKWQGCAVTSSSALPATNRAPGVTCQHGGQCQSGMCLGVVPGQDYRCSCNDPKTRWNSCTR